MSESNLLFTRKFWPIFWTQFLGAFNDNVFKNALVILITFKSYQLLGLQTEQMVALCGGVFILPFFLFSAMAGQICDKYPKHRLTYFIKIWEVLVMLLGAAGFLIENVPLLLITLFLMGLQSTFFGPVKYAILPELIEDEEMVNGNALVEMGTFLAILLGTILGGVLIGVENGKYFVGISVIIFALLGTFFSKKVQTLSPSAPDLKIDWGLVRPTWDILKILRQNKGVMLSVFGISWFWFLGAALLSMFPVYVKNVFSGNENVVTLFLAIFSIGVAAGSMICEKLSAKRLELGLVPVGTIGMSLFIIDLYFVGVPLIDLSKTYNVIGFLGSEGAIRVLIDLLGLSIFSGFYIVPLYTFIQTRSQDGVRSRVIAANNILNSFLIVLSALFLMFLYAKEFSFPQIFLILGIVNILVSIYIYTVIPEFLIRFVSFILTKIMYRFKVVGEENIPEEGAAILTCNHVSFVDWLVVAAGVKRPPRFVMYYKFMNYWPIAFLAKGGRVIPIAGKNEDPEILEKAMNEIEQVLKDGHMVCIFPEGFITSDGELMPFRPGIERMLERIQVPVIPMTLNGLWGSFFSRKYNGRALSSGKAFLTRWFSRVELHVFGPWEPSSVTAKKLEDYTRSKL